MSLKSKATLIGSAALLAGLAALFAFRAEFLLHCSQSTSVALAYLEWEVHEEERPVPLAYDPVTGLAVRVWMGSIEAGLLFVAPVLLVLYAVTDMRLRGAVGTQAAVIVCAFGHLWVPLSIVGERIHELLLITLTGYPLVLLVQVGALLSAGRKSRSTPENPATL